MHRQSRVLDELLITSRYRTSIRPETVSYLACRIYLRHCHRMSQTRKDDSPLASVDTKMSGQIRLSGESLVAVCKGTNERPSIGVVSGSDMVVVVDELS
jgi:hypothetical protein